MAKKLAQHVGKTVAFGVRPEDINDKKLAGQANPNQVVRASVDVVEPMGAEIYLYLNTGNHTFIARVNSRETADVGQQVETVFDMRKCHFFDTQTEQTIA